MRRSKSTSSPQTTDHAWVCPLGDDAGLAFATIWDDKLEVQLKVPAEETKFQYLDVATATTLHAWLGEWLAAHAPATGEGR